MGQEEGDEKEAARRRCPKATMHNVRFGFFFLPETTNKPKKKCAQGKEVEGVRGIK